jgi:hypothetical protein
LPAGHAGGVDPTTGLPAGQRAILADAGNSGMRNSIMTIRVKKSDVDAFAKGKLTLDEFRKKAGTAIYTADLGGGGNFSFNFTGGEGLFDIPSRSLRIPAPLNQPFSTFGSGGGEEP